MVLQILHFFSHWNIQSYLDFSSSLNMWRITKVLHYFIILRYIKIVIFILLRVTCKMNAPNLSETYTSAEVFSFLRWRMDTVQLTHWDFALNPVVLVVGNGFCISGNAVFVPSHWIEKVARVCIVYLQKSLVAIGIVG